MVDEITRHHPTEGGGVHEGKRPHMAMKGLIYV